MIPANLFHSVWEISDHTVRSSVLAFPLKSVSLSLSLPYLTPDQWLPALSTVLLSLEQVPRNPLTALRLAWFVWRWIWPHSPLLKYIQHCNWLTVSLSKHTKPCMIWILLELVFSHVFLMPESKPLRDSNCALPVPPLVTCTQVMLNKLLYGTWACSWLKDFFVKNGYNFILEI